MNGIKFNLSWKEFEDNASKSHKKLINDTHFTDVTLSCHDNMKLQAHKVILSSSSPVLEQILLDNPHQHPVIYFRTVNYACLQALIQFMYLGQAEVAQTELEDFMKLAKELEVDGLNNSSLDNNEEPHDMTIS